jgi:hypothetical protein
MRSALQRAAAHRAAGHEVQVQFDGRVHLDVPLDLAALLGEGAGQRVALRGPAVLDGGTPISGWAIVKHGSSGWLWAAPVPASLQNVTVTQMWDGPDRVSPARTPVLHYNRTGQENMTTTDTASIVTTAADGSSYKFDKLKALPSVRLFVYHSWDVSYHPLSAIRPAADGLGGLELVAANQISLRWNSGGLTGASGQRYYLEGAEEFLHEGSGTFVHDAASQQLLYAPKLGGAPGETVAANLVVSSQAICHWL